MASKAQSILFDRQKWDLKAAREWLREHGYKSRAPDTTDRYYRFRQADPTKFGSFATIPFGESSGIKAVIGFKNNPNTNEANVVSQLDIGDLGIPLSVVALGDFDLESGGVFLQVNAGEIFTVFCPTDQNNPYLYATPVGGKEMIFKIPRNLVRPMELELETVKPQE